MAITKKQKLAGGVVVLCLISFYGGMKYGANTSANGRNFTQGGNYMGGANGMRTRTPRSGNFVVGDVLTIDGKNMTVKLRDGGSRIVILSETTQVMKADAGSILDIATGNSVMITGSVNSDGSMTAQSVQIRPAMPTPSSSNTANQ